MAGKRFSIRYSSLVRCLLLSGLVLCFYAIDNPSIIARINSTVYNYIFKPGFWIGLAYFAGCLPKVRFKSKYRFRSFINWWAFNFSLILVAALIMGGIVDGFGKSPYNHSIRGIFLNIILTGSMLIGRERIRSYFVNSLTDEENYFVFIFVALFMTFTGISFNRFSNLHGIEGIVKFAAQHVAPEFSQNLFAVYLSYLGGPLPSGIYLGMVQAFNWFSPVLPNMKWITAALIGVLCPVFSLTVMQNMYAVEARIVKRKDREKESPLSWILTSLLSIAIIWFAVGVFPIYPSVVATGSMEPIIKPGDVILVNKSIYLNNLKTGDVIQFQRENILISHRIIEIIEDAKGKSFRTKGDNNSAADGEAVKPELVKGKIIRVVPKIGWPTLLLRSKKHIPMEKIEF